MHRNCLILSGLIFCLSLHLVNFFKLQHREFQNHFKDLLNRFSVQSCNAKLQLVSQRSDMDSMSMKCYTCVELQSSKNKFKGSLKILLKIYKFRKFGQIILVKMYLKNSWKKLRHYLLKAPCLNPLQISNAQVGKI